MNIEQIRLALQPPRLLPPISAWLAHIPFGMVLVDLLRPRQIVELGTHMGASYAAFCQAVATLGLDTQCTAVDIWTGDAQSGRYGADVLAALRAHHDPLYARFSRLLQARFDDAADTFAPGSIDLLHLDGLHTYEAVRHDVDRWLPMMSPSGVMLFHDTQVRQDDFGVWKLWEELAPRYPSFEFTHGYGLGVLAVGPQIAPGMTAFFDWAAQSPEAVRELFSRLGKLLVLARDGAALGGLDQAERRSQWRQWSREALQAAQESLLALPGALGMPQRTARLEALLDAHAPFWRTVSVVIPTRNAGPTFGRVLKGLREQTFAGEIDLLVIDSGSSDDTLAQARSAAAQILQIPPSQFHHAATRNLAIQHCTGDLVLLLTQDALPADPGMVTALVRAFADPDVAGVYARQLPRPEHDPLVAWRVAHSYAGGPQRQERYIADRAAYDQLPPWQRMELCVFDNVCAAVRRSVWQQIPIPPVDFAEDMAWAQDVLEAGWKIVFEPAARVLHSHARGLAHEFDRHLHHAQAMRELFYFREIPRLSALPAKLLHGIRRDLQIIRAANCGWPQRLALQARVPASVAARVLGTYIGGSRKRALSDAGQVEL